MERTMQGTFTNGNFDTTFTLTGDGDTASLEIMADQVMRSLGACVYCDLVPVVTATVSQQERQAGTVNHTVTVDPVVVGDTTANLTVSVTLDVDVPADELSLDEVIRATVTDPAVEHVTNIINGPSISSLLGSIVEILGGGGVGSIDGLGGVQILDLGALLGGGIFSASGDGDLCPDCGTDHSDPAAAMAGLFLRRASDDDTGSLEGDQLVSASQPTDLSTPTS